MFTFVYSRVVVPRIKTSLCYQVCKRHFVKYTQGQAPEPRVREYFYYIDHQAVLGRCTHEELHVVLQRNNNTERYREDFPYVSLCGPERNFVRCDDLPIVFTKVVQKQNSETGKIDDWFGYAHSEELLMVPFQPEKLYMNVQSGRVYHPAPQKAGGIGLVRSKIAIEFSSLFTFERGEQHCPTHFTWKDNKYTLDTDWYKDRVLQCVGQK